RDGAPGSARSPSARALRPGDVLGSYRVERMLGHGGMGAVFLATDSTLRRQLAIKLLDSVDDNARSRARLLREARSAAALNHPNICTIYEVSEAAGAAFIAMEYVEGRTLSDRISEGPLPTQQIIHYGIQIADALDHAHTRKIVHRDLKSANVVTTHDGHVKVL